MSQIEKIFLKILTGQSDNNIDFSELRNLLINLGFDERIKGSHHIFTKNNIEEIINLQPVGKLAKSYQVRQVRNIITKYSLGDING